MAGLIVGLAFTGCEEDGFRPCVRGNGGIRSEGRALAEFRSIDHRLDGNIEVKKGPSRIVIEGYDNQLTEVRTSVSSGRLVIDSDRCLRNTEFSIVVYTPEFDELKLAGTKNGNVEAGFSAPEMRFELSGSGCITAAGTAERVRAKVSGSGDITIVGTTGAFRSDISGSGDIHSFGLTATTVDVNVSGSGSVETTVSERLEANISGSGKVYYKGNPPTVNSNISASGKVIRQ